MCILCLTRWEARLRNILGTDLFRQHSCGSADQTYLTQSHCTDTWPVSPSTDPIIPSFWQGSYKNTHFKSLVWSDEAVNLKSPALSTDTLPFSHQAIRWGQTVFLSKGSFLRYFTCHLTSIGLVCVVTRTLLRMWKTSFNSLTLNFLSENVNVQSRVLYWLTRTRLFPTLFQYLLSLED